MRPCGQYLGDGRRRPRSARARRLDIELELGFVVGVPSAQGERVPVERALEHVFGVVLLNDWSARDLQAWEYRPLGPFLGKSFATSVSRLGHAAGRAAGRAGRPPQEPAPLAVPAPRTPWALDVALEVELNGERIVARTNARAALLEPGAAWSRHLTANGASLRTGDLLGSGTDLRARRARARLADRARLERRRRRPFLADGDEVVLRGAGLGEVRGRIVPAR